MRKKLFWSALIIGIFWLMLQASSAFANCASGVCSVEINATTGVITYTDAPPKVAVVQPVGLEPVLPTHTINVQTSNSGWQTAGTPDQISQAVKTLTPQPLTIDPCFNGGCAKVEVNTTTGITTVLPLSEADLKQRAKDQVEQSQRQAELAKSAYQALPNITAWQTYDLFIDEPFPATIQDTELTPEWWSNWLTSLNLFFESWFWWWSL
jgi:hypothetical protein